MHACVCDSDTGAQKSVIKNLSIFGILYGLMGNIDFNGCTSENLNCLFNKKLEWQMLRHETFYIYSLTFC